MDFQAHLNQSFVGVFSRQSLICRFEFKRACDSSMLFDDLQKLYFENVKILISCIDEHPMFKTIEKAEKTLSLLEDMLKNSAKNNDDLRENFFKGLNAIRKILNE